MALSRGTTYVELRARLDQYKRDLAMGEKMAIGSATRTERTMGQKMSAFGNRTTAMANTLSRRLVLPFIGLGTVAINEFSEVQKVSAQTDAALESTGGVANVTRGHIQNLSATIGELSAQDAELVQAAENVLLTFTKVRNEVGEGNDIFDQASLAAADLAARLGTDLQSEMLRVGKAVNDPIKGVTALTRAGVQFTDQQKEQIETLVESGDVIGAQKLVLAELQKQVGGSAAAAGRAASPFEKLKLSFNQFAETLGESLMPLLQDFADILSVVTRWFGNLSPGVRKFVLVLGGVALVAGPVITAIKAIGVALSFLVANPIGAAITAADLLAIVIIKNWNKVKAITAQVWDFVYGKIKFVWDTLIKWNPAVLFVRLAIGAFSKLKGVAGAIFVWMVDKVNWVIDRVQTLIGWISKAVGFLKGAIDSATSSGIEDAIEKYRNMTGDTGGGGIGGGNLGSSLVQIGTNLQKQGFRVAGHPAFPPVGTHTEGSMHYVGRAIDVNWGAPGQSAEEMSVLNGLAAKLKATTSGIVELIYPGTGDPNHQDHLHLAMDGGGIVKGPATIHQGSITEAHIPLTGPGAKGMFLTGVLEIPGLGRAILRGAQLTFDGNQKSSARASRWQSKVAT